MAKHQESSPEAAPPSTPTDAHESDPALLRENSQFKTYTTRRFTYPDIRVFFKQHPKAAELPKSPAPLPLLVCIPGLGGSVAQFHPLLGSLTDLAPCLAIDYPGGGRSKFALTQWEAYTSQALMELFEVIIEDYRDNEAGQAVVLIGHSMGTALCAGLASKAVHHATALAEHVVGFVAICPVAEPLNEAKTNLARKFLWVPAWLFSLWRAWDGMGGPQSASVSRFVGEGAEQQLRVLQHRFNQQSKTPVWMRTAGGALAVYENGKPVGGLPGLNVWASLDIPVYLIGGEKDHITPTTEVDKIVKAMKTKESGGDEPRAEGPPSSADEAVDSATPVSASLQPQDHIASGISAITEDDFQNKNKIVTTTATAKNTIADSSSSLSDDLPEDPSTPRETPPSVVPPQPLHPAKVVQSIIMPSPANHTLLYTPHLSRALAGLISDFLAAHITPRFSLGWQLQYLSHEGKWDVKNLTKWTGVVPVSDPVGPAGAPVFRAMKTLREADAVHCPREFVGKWGRVVKDVVDISLDQPVYDPRGLERAGVHYHKLPTVSKVPPQAHEVDAFIALVDKLRARQARRAEEEAWEDPAQCVVGVHCHYGYNRTGYFIVCYLVERCGYALPDAIEEFKTARPNGIRHSHFLDRLYVRYNLEAPQVAAT